jgi:uncharacterized protein (DUF362 family)
MAFCDVKTVGVVSASRPTYPSCPPFHPDCRYPEYAYTETSSNPNPVYAALRGLLLVMELDAERFGTPAWDPLGEFIRPGDRVVLKPNWVLDADTAAKPIEALVTHGSIIRAVLDFVLVALRGSGSVVIFDTPIMDANFGRIVKQSGAQSAIDYLARAQQVPIAIVDGRQRVLVAGRHGETLADHRVIGDPEGYAEFDLGADSLHVGLGADWRRFDVGKGELDIMRMAHNDSNHRYLISRSVLEADVVINLPKIKTHVKAGVTGALKNIIGIVGDKSYLPHYRRGGSRRGGDEYEGLDVFMEVRDRVADFLRPKGKLTWQFGRAGWASLRRLAAAVSRTPGASRYDVKSGSWPGNDTLWRTILDVNRILFYGARNGTLHRTPQRRCLALADGIVCGESCGPLSPDPIPGGFLLGSVNPVALDIVAARLMGYDHRNLPAVKHAFDLVGAYCLASFKADEIEVLGQFPQLPRAFVEPPGWEGHLLLPPSTN